MKAYGMDLRERIVRAVEQGMSTVQRYVRLGRGGSLAAKASPGRSRLRAAAGAAALRAQVAAHPDATLAEHRAI